jgi:hypothetical protein
MTSLSLPSMLALKGTRQFGFAALAISLLILSPVAFHSKVPLVFYRFDGTYLLITAMMQKAWAVSDWYFTSNPLQGIGGLELPQHNLIDPALKDFRHRLIALCNWMFLNRVSAVAFLIKRFRHGFFWAILVITSSGFTFGFASR